MAACGCVGGRRLRLGPLRLPRLAVSLLPLLVLLGAARAGEDAAPRSLGTGHLRDPARVVAVAFVASGARLVSGDQDGSFVVRDAATRRILASCSPVASDALRFPVFAFAPDGSRVFAAASGSSAIRVHDAATGVVKATFETLEGGVRSLAASPDGALLAVRHEGAVSLLDASSGALVRKHVLGATIGLCFSPDGSTLAVSAKDGVFFYAVASGAEARKKLVWRKKRDKDDDDEDDVNLGAHVPTNMAFSPDASRLATAGGRSIRVWDLEADQLDFELEAEDFVGPVAWSRDGKRLASASDDERVHIWSIAKQKEIGALEGHGEATSAVAYSPDGAVLVSGGKDATVRAWAARSGEELEEFAGHLAAVRSLAFAKGGERLLTAGDDKHVIEWDLATGAALHERDRAGLRVVASSDGERDAIEGQGKLTIERGEDVIRELETPDETLRVVGFAAAGKQLVACTEGTHPSLVVYSAKDGEEIQRSRLGKAAVAAAALDATRGVLVWADARARLWTTDLDEGTTRRFDSPRPAKDLALSPDGQELAVLDDAGQLVVLDARTGAERRALGAAEGPLVFGPKGLLLAGSRLLGAGAPRTLPIAKPTAANFNVDGTLLAVGDATGGVTLLPLAR